MKPRTFVAGLMMTLLRSRLSMRGQEYRSINDLPPQLRELAVKYRNAIADVLGLPPEAIREDVVVKWVTDWVKAYVKPEYWHEIHALLYTWEPKIVLHVEKEEVAPGVYVKRVRRGILY